ncbi:MAG: amino acid transporter [Actinomycetia bacterium]|nr:amino acid transporter [Actinomycetes bacterium]
MTSRSVSQPQIPTQPGVFTRASSGLVRQVRTQDVMFYGWQQIALGYIIFIVAAWQFYPGASMEVGVLLATAAGILIAICYAFLSVVYPRSGGDYVFMSRILHPAAGLVLSMSLIFWQLFYAGINGAFLSKFGLAPMFSTLGIQTGNHSLTAIGSWFTSPWGLFSGGALVIGVFSIVQYLGVGLYFKAQRWASYVAIGSLLVTVVTLILASTGVLSFQHNFDVVAGHGAYQGVLHAAASAGVSTHHSFSFSQSLYFAAWPAFSLWFAVLSVSFGGEVKDGQRSQFRGMNLAIITMGGFMLLLMFLYRMAFGSGFILASSQLPTNKFPLNAAPYVNLYTGIAGGNVVLTVVNSLWVLALLFFVGASSLVASTRNMLAWSLDGVAPKWFSAVSARRHTPTWSLVLCAVIATIWALLYSFTDTVLVLGGFLGQCVPILGVCVAAIVFPFRRREDFESSPIAYRIGRVPLITVVGVVAAICVGFCFYRLLVDTNYGANNTLSVVMTLGAAAFAALWFLVYRLWNKARGTDLNAQFKEIPIE